MSPATDAPVRVPGRLLGPGLLAAGAAAAVTTAAAALLRAAGADFSVQGGEVVPVSGIGVVTAVCCLVGLGLASALARWAARPAERFAQGAAVLTALSLLPPLAWGDDPPTTAALVALHLLAAGVMVPPLVARLRQVSPPAG